MTHPWQIADENIPSDVREMARRWKMGEALIEMWRGAWIEGYLCAKREASPNLGPAPALSVPTDVKEPLQLALAQPQ